MNLESVVAGTIAGDGRGAGPESRPALGAVRVEVDRLVGGESRGALVTLSALRACWLPRRGGLWPLRTLNVTGQAIEVPERLVELLAEVLELADPLSPIGQELIDPLQDNRSA